MRLLTKALLLSSWVAFTAALQTACPLRGRQYLSPDDIADQAEFRAVAESLNGTLDALVKKSAYDGLTFSAAVFSTSSPDLLWQYHHASAGVECSEMLSVKSILEHLLTLSLDAQILNSTQGAKTINADSIYRIGSISKLLTVLIFLVNDGDLHWNDPITKYLPVLSEYAAQSSGLTSPWEDVTIGDLAGQMAGLSRDYGLGDFAPPKNDLLPISPEVMKAFPDLPESEVPTCGYLLADGTLVVCTEDEYLKGAGTEAPIFSPALTPVYSNEGFALLGLVMQNLTGESLETLFNRDLVDALSLRSTFYTTPLSITAQDIVPGKADLVGWAGDFGVFAPAGGFYSSTNDFATIGRAIMSSKLLSRARTDRWFKPTSFVYEFSQGVGRPWEIFRRMINGASVEIFVKGGDWGIYHTFFALVPDYDIGFIVFTANDLSSAVDGLHGQNGIPNLVLDKVLTAVDDIAKNQAAETFGGHYTDASTNSSITFDTDPTETGLLVTSWISNGVDVLGWIEGLQSKLVYRIVPNQLASGSQVGFTSFYWSRAPPPPNDIWYWTCPGWVDVDELTYGNVPFGQMVFNMGDDGKPASVELRALRITLTKQS